MLIPDLFVSELGDNIEQCQQNITFGPSFGSEDHPQM